MNSPLSRVRAAENTSKSFKKLLKEKYISKSRPLFQYVQPSLGLPGDRYQGKTKYLDIGIWLIKVLCFKVLNDKLYFVSKKFEAENISL